MSPQDLIHSVAGGAGGAGGGGRAGRRRTGQWIGLTLAAGGMAAATVAVPPLIAPHHDAEPAPSAASSPSAVPPKALATGAAPAASSAPASSAPASSAPARFTPIGVQAEDPGNRLTGGASVVACGTCRGGRRVRYLCPACTLVVRATLPVAGSRTVTVYYEVDGPRTIKVSVNGAPARTWPVDGPDWTVPQSFRFTAELPAGDLQLTFYNDESPAPDLDEVVIS